MLHPDTPISEVRFAVADIETTGLSPHRDAIVEIAVVSIEPPLVLNLHNSFNTLVNPLRPIPYEATRIHGITNSMVRQAPLLKEVVTRFKEHVEGHVLVFHNAQFDYNFISRAWQKHAIISPKTHIVDTLRLSRKIHPHLPSHKLDTLIDHYQVTSPRPADHRHRALFDTDLTAMIFLQMLQTLQAKGIHTLRQLMEYHG